MEPLEGGAFASDHGRHQELHLLFWYHWFIVAVILSHTAPRVDGAFLSIHPYTYVHTGHIKAGTLGKGTDRARSCMYPTEYSVQGDSSHIM